MQDSIAKEKSGVKNVWKLYSLRGGGGVRSLMEKSILKFHFNYWNPSLKVNFDLSIYSCLFCSLSRKLPTTQNQITMSPLHHSFVSHSSCPLCLQLPFIIFFLSRSNQTKPTEPNLPNQTSQTKLPKPNLPNQAYQTKFTKPNIPNQTYQNKPTKPNLPHQTHRTKITG